MDVMKDSRLRRLWTWPGVELEKTLDVTEVEVGCPGKVENRDGSKRRGVLAGFYTWYQSHGAHTRCVESKKGMITSKQTRNNRKKARVDKQESASKSRQARVDKQESISKNEIKAGRRTNMDVMKDSRLRRLWTWPGVELEKTLDVTEVEVGCPGKVENRDGSKRRSWNEARVGQASLKTDSPSVSQGTTFKAVVQPDLTYLPEIPWKIEYFWSKRLRENREFPSNQIAISV
ncbi:hypothetical protein Tco_1121623 [Tanacetum coccineum]|uniref:Uncharacterized protein n=1 Tax=Tanacetum coccineum TaxID=301880 RepID=A0ABQ5J169_9ASTR